MVIAAGQWLHTKLHRPRGGRDLVTRPRLIERLNQGFCARLTLVCAPAAYGKSTLLAKWFRATGNPAAWLSLHHHDNDLHSFLRYFVAALRTQFPVACPVALRMAAAAPSPLAPEHMPEREVVVLGLLAQHYSYTGIAGGVFNVTVGSRSAPSRVGKLDAERQLRSHFRSSEP